MDSSKAKQKFILSMVASSLLVACNDSSSDPKGTSSSGGSNSPFVLSGTAIDGYLVNAKVCLDKNADMKCDVSDGQIVRTDQNGQFTLPYSNPSDLNFPIIVEAISGETIDSDQPESAIEHSFGLVAEANNSEVITPLTTLVIERAKHDGVSYQDAEAALAAELSITVEDLGSDYVAGNNETDQQLHALARSVTQLMKDAEQASLTENVDRFKARKALHGKLAMIDVSGMKKKTDVLVANGTVDAQTLKVVSDEVVDDVKVTSEEVSTGVTSIKPPTPKNGVVDDKNDLFGWAWAGRLTAVEDYEYSVDNGVTWQQVTANPQPMGDNSYSAGTVQVRVKAKKEINRLAGDALKSSSDFAKIVYVTPVAPSAITTNDANNTFTWDVVTGYDAAELYEYSLDNGATWQAATANPQSIADQVIAVGHLQVRVKAQSENHVLSGESVSSTTAMTLTPAQPSAPAITNINDASDTFTWDLVSGFSKLSDYEYNLGNGWVEATTQTISVGDINIPAGTIKVRVKADPITGRAAGVEGIVTTSFSKDMMVLPAPMNAVVDDGNNTLTFTYAAGFGSASDYQISLDSGVTWEQVTKNPQSVPDKAYSAGQVAVRTFNSKGEYSPSLLNKDAFTVTPATPSAPISQNVSDINNTFGWALVNGFSSLSDYEININGTGWKTATANPTYLDDQDYAVGAIQVRVKADAKTGRKAGAILSNSKAFTVKPTQPMAPSSPVTDDANNTFGWTTVSGFSDLAEYEYQINNGAWLSVTSNPIKLEDKDYAKGSIAVRVKADSYTGRPAGLSLTNTTEFTVTPEPAVAPTAPQVDDASNTFGWAKVVGFDAVSDYEIKVGSAAWKEATANPMQLDNVVYAVGAIQVRVKADELTGRLAGAILTNHEAYTVTPDQPAAPSTPQTDDVNNTFGWTNVAGFSASSDYEVKIGLGNWQTVTSNPVQLEDKDYAKGSISVRVKEDTKTGRPAGRLMSNTVAFTVTPVRPVAPTAGIVNDAQNTFSWAPVTGFSELSDYEIQIGSSAWQTVNSNPASIPDSAYAVGTIKVRVKADTQTGREAGVELTNTEAFTQTPEQPAAPTSPQVDDAANTFGWAPVSGFNTITDYEIKVGGAAWKTVSNNPESVSDVAHEINSILVRVKADEKTGRPAGLTLSNDVAMTVTPDLPSAPTAPVVDDANNSFGWTNVAGFNVASDYEVKIGGSPWQPVSQNPVSIPDQAYAVGEILVRVKTDTTNGRPAGQALSNDKIFTATPNKPATPTAPVVDDALNTFGWTNVSGFDVASDYEIKVGAAEWAPASANPMTIADGDFAIGDVKVRVKADSVTGRAESDSVSNTKAFTLTPAQPSAPTGIVVNDAANTFDWTFVTGFTQATDYELSTDNGAMWFPVTVKPVNVGDNAYGVGQVQVRVKANAENGMPAGLSASNPSEFFDVIPADAPTLPVVVNTSSIKTNGLNWTVTTGFDQATDYEFTNDGGTTWQDVVSIPQHIGYKAYDKTTVGVRVKSDSKSNRPAGNTLWATTATVDFEALKYVEYGENGKPLPLNNSPYSQHGDWLGSAQCEAYYETENSEPVFWLPRTSLDSDRIDAWIADANKDQKCNLGIWQAPSYALAKTLSGLADTNNKFIHTGSTYWGKKDDGTYQAIQDGADYTGDTKWRVVYLSAQAVLPATSEVKSFVASTKSALELGVTNSQTSWQTVEQDWTGVISGFSSTLTLAELTQDKADVTALIASLPTLISQIEAVITAQEANIQKSAAYIALVQQRAGLTEQDKALLNADLAAAQAALKTLKERKASAEMLQKAEKITATYIDLRIVELALTQSSQKLDATLLGADGALMHSDAQALYAKLEELKQTLLTLTAQQAQFSSDLTAVSSELVAQLVTQFDQLALLVNTKVSSFDTAGLKVHEDKAKQGFDSAWQNGYSVSVDQAKVATNFAKLDINGKYLPTATTYAQGWRCVMDLRNPERNRVWSLLQNGLGNGVDDMAYEASSAKTLLGAGGFLETTNQAQLCGYNDWKVPSYFLFETLKTKSFPKQYGGTFDSIDTDVFPNHRGHEPYESYTSPRYYYWASDAVSRSDEAAVFRFQSPDESERKASSDKDGSDLNAYTFARLVRETPIAYQLLLENGTNTTDRSAARCVVDPTTNLTWQLFTAADATRFKILDDIKTEATSKTSCGKSAWRLPTVAELQSLYPVDNAVFPYSVVPKDGLPASDQHNARVCYASSAESQEYGRDYVECVSMSDGTSENKSVGQSYNPYTKYNFIYRLVAQ